MAGHIAQGAGAEVPPAAEVPRRVDGVVGAVRGGAQEEVPVQRLGDLLRLGRALESLGPDGPVGEGLHASDLADLAVPDPVADLADALVGGALVAHLRGYLVLGGQLGEQAGFVDGAGERLLHVDVLAGLDGGSGDDRVRVVGRGDHHGISLVQHLVEHHPPVLVALGVGIALEDVGSIFPIHVAQADDLFRLQPAEDAGSASADPHAEDLELAVEGSGRFVPAGEQFVRHHREPERCGGPCFEERPSGNVFWHNGYRVLVLSVWWPGQNKDNQFNADYHHPAGR